MKKVWFVLLALAFVLAGCGDPVVVTEKVVETVEVPVVETVEVEKEVTIVETVEVLVPQEEDELPPLVFSILNGQHPVVRLMRLGFWDACRDYNFNCEEVLVMEPDIDGYVSAMDQVGTMDARAAVIYNDNDALIAGAERLTEIMPTVSFHMPFPKGECPNTAWVSADTTAYAIDAARRMGDKMGGEGVIATSISNPNGVEDAVIAAFKETIAEEYPNITVLDEIYEGLDLNQAIALAASQIQAHPELTAAFSTTGNGANTWATALRDAGYEAGEVVVVGMDYTPQNLELIKSGEVWGVVGQPLVEEVYEATIIADRISRGLSYDEQNWLPAPFVTIDNVDYYMDYSIRSMED